MSKKKIIIGGLILALILLLCLFFVYSFHSFTNQQEQSSQKLFDELEAARGERSKLESAILTLAGENNTLRRALNLPEKELSLFASPGKDEEEAEKSKENDDLLFYSAIEKLQEHEEALDAAALLSRLRESESFRSQLDSLGLIGRQKSRRQLSLLYADEEIGSLSLQGKSQLSFLDSSGKSQYEGRLDRKDPRIEDACVQAIESQKMEVKAVMEKKQEASSYIQELFKDSGIRKAAGNRRIRFSSMDERSGLSSFTLKGPDGRRIITVQARIEERLAGLELDGSFISDPSRAREELLAKIESADLRSIEEKQVDDARERIQALGSDEAFIEYLKQQELSLASKTREDNDYYYYDLSDADGELKGALAVQKMRGEIYLCDRDDVVISSLKRLSLEDPTTKEAIDFPLPSDEELAAMGSISSGGKNVLLIGSHENNADTIMIARVKDGRADLLALPRDLWWKNRKLNAYYRIYGAQRFMEVVSEISGLKVDDYIEIDMYAFIDVINILGGIELELKEALIDPTYKIRENGEWKTLHYSAGTHLLDGIAALRVARSRHTSDDFDRAKRQQMVISSIKDRFDSLGAGDINTFYRLFHSIQSYIDTSFSAVELAKLYLDNRHVELYNQGGLNTDNVLVATYSNLLATGKSKEEVADDFYKGAWILVPKENNWNLIPWHLNKLLMEDSIE